MKRTISHEEAPFTTPAREPHDTAPPRPRQPWYRWVISTPVGILVLIGLLCLLSAGGVFLLLGHVVTHTQTTTRAFSVTAAPTLIVHDTAGSVTVKAGQADTITVQITKKVTTTLVGSAQGDFDQLAVQVNQAGNTITAEALFAPGGGLSPERLVDLLIQVPAPASLNLQVVTGTLDLEGVSGLVKATVETGKVQATMGKVADGSEIHVTTGSITLNGAIDAGAALTLRADTGNVEVSLPASTSAHVDASTQIGKLNITGWSLKVARSGTGASASGDLGTAPRGTITIRVGTGEVSLTAR
jgi:hypothetical protein